jgi:hypothetical protein
LWNKRCRISRVTDLIFVDIGNKMIALAIKGLEELRFLAVTAVNANANRTPRERA